MSPASCKVRSWIYSLSLLGPMAVSTVSLTWAAACFAAETPARPSAPHTTVRAEAAPADQPLTIETRIAAVVNGDVISEADIGNRALLFAISLVLPLYNEFIDRLKPKI